MLFKNEIASLALGHLGSSLGVVDLATDNSNQAKIIRRHLRMSLNTLLESHEWSFATQFQALPLSSEDPYPGYLYEYITPADALIIRQIAEEGIFPKVNLYEQQKLRFREVQVGGSTRIWTNIRDAHAEYTAKVSEDAAFPTHFGRGLSYQLAMDIGAQLITNNWPKVKATLIAEAKNEISNAIALDLSRQPLKQDSPNPFLLARME